MSQKRAAIILAAGQGKRMQSTLPKVLHTIGGRPMLDWSLSLAKSLKADPVLVVTSSEKQIKEHVQAMGALSVEQTIPKGTGDAVKQAFKKLQGFEGEIIILFSDTPLLCKETGEKLFHTLEKSTSLSLLGFEAKLPFGYGRIILDKKNNPVHIIEEKDASLEQKEITLCNSGVMCAHSGFLSEALSLLETKNAQNEYYLTDLVGIAYLKNQPASLVRGEQEEMSGVNTRYDLTVLEALFQKQMRRKALASGIGLSAPDTVYFSYDTEIAKDAYIEPYVIFGTGVQIGSGTIIRSFSYIEGAKIGADSQIGPYARLRPGSLLEEEVKIGNFVEIKNTQLARKAKVNHLSYLGDARIGMDVNIGAGTITCNYDGVQKYRTEINEKAFIGSNTSLIAPVSIGKNAYVGSGSVITHSVPNHALALARKQQINKKDWVLKSKKTDKKNKEEKG